MWQLVIADHLLAAKAGSEINWQAVITDVLLFGTVCAAVWLGWLTRNLVKQSIADVRETREARYDQQRPVLLPSNGGHALEVKHVLGYPAALYADLRAELVTVNLANIGTGPALDVRGILCGPAPGDLGEVRSWRSFVFGVPIGSGEQQSIGIAQGGIDIPGSALTGRQKKYTLYAPPLPDPSRLPDRVNPVIVARLTITCRDIFGRKHASIFDYTSEQRWVSVDEGFFPDIPRDLGDLEREHMRPPSPPAFLPTPTGPSPIPPQLQA